MNLDSWGERLLWKVVLPIGLFVARIIVVPIGYTLEGVAWGAQRIPRVIRFLILGVLIIGFFEALLYITLYPDQFPRDMIFLVLLVWGIAVLFVLWNIFHRGLIMDWLED